MKADEIHVWNGCIAAGRNCFLELYGSLSEDEIEKADGFHFGKHRRSYIICRGLLRAILGAYLRVEPAEIKFQYGPEGKPFLQGHTVCFSVSHSEDRVLYALCRSHELGVDLEYVRELPDIETLAQHSLAPSEYAAFCNTVPAVRTRAFYCCWTRKEAYMKATGRGLSLRPESVDVLSEHTLPEKGRIMLGPDAKSSDWSLRHLDPAPRYVGALVTPLASAPLLEWTFESAEECGERIHRLLSESPLDSRLL